MKKNRLVHALVVLMWLMALFGYSMEVNLEYQLYADDWKDFRPWGNGQFQKTFIKPEGDWKFPEFNSEKPVYSWLELGDTKRLVILDQKDKSDSFYNRIYFDADANKDLTNDPVINATEEREQSHNIRIAFPVVQTSYMIGEVEMPYAYQPQIYYYYINKSDFDLNRLNYFYYVRCSYHGQFKLNDKTYKILAFDKTGNGLYNDYFSIPQNYKEVYKNNLSIYASGDCMYLTTGEKIVYEDYQHLPEMIILDGNLYDLEVDTAKTKITITESKKEVHKVSIPMNSEKISLYNLENKNSLAIYKPGEGVDLPTGKWLLVDYLSERKDEQGDSWRLQARGTIKTPLLDVRSKQNNEMKMGEPYRAVISPNEWSLQNFKNGGDGISMAMNCMGKGEEIVSDVSHFAGNKTVIPLSKKRTNRPEEPTYRIMSKESEILTSGNFEYG